MASTFKDILVDLWLQVANKATIRLSCEVTKIATSQAGVVDIGGADGFRGSFENVIVTAPMGWLKRNEDVFSPPLTSTILNAVRSLGYGNLDRVFIKSPRIFWGYGAPGLNDYHEQGAELGEARSSTFPVESLFLRPEYAADTNPTWRQEIISLASLPEPYSQPIIMFFVYGQWGRQITGVVRGMKQYSREYYKILDDHFRPYYSKLPNYDVDDPSASLQNSYRQTGKMTNFRAMGRLPICLLEPEIALCTSRHSERAWARIAASGLQGNTRHLPADLVLSLALIGAERRLQEEWQVNVGSNSNIYYRTIC